MRYLSLCIDGFSVALLSQRSPGGDSPPEILRIVCDSIRTQLGAKSVFFEDSRILVLEALELLKSLSWNIPTALVPK